MSQRDEGQADLEFSTMPRDKDGYVVQSTGMHSGFEECFAPKCYGEGSVPSEPHYHRTYNDPRKVGKQLLSQRASSAPLLPKVSASEPGSIKEALEGTVCIHCNQPDCWNDDCVDLWAINWHTRGHPNAISPPELACKLCRAEPKPDPLLTGPDTPPPGVAYKHKSGKPRISLIPLDIALNANVYEYGAKKVTEKTGSCGDDNWLQGMPWRDCLDALLRHIVKWSNGEDIDQESNLPHLDHARFWINALLKYQKENIGEDNRRKVR